MRATLWLQVAAGVAALVGGLRLASRSLRGSDGGATRRWLARATGHWAGAVATGLLATMLIHSSSLTTIAVVGLVDAGALTLEAAAGVVVGANVGSTLAVHLLAWRPGPWMPFVLALLAAPFAFGRGRRARAARVALGAALLLQGLAWIEVAAARIGAAPWFATAMYALDASVWLGVLVGIVLTTLVLSSALSIGILQRLTVQRLLSLRAALPVLFGANVGTTTDTLLASIGTSRDARRAALFHLLFNVVGTALFLVLLPGVTRAVRWAVGDPALQIAFAHTLFNLVTAVAVLPCRGWLIRATDLLLPGRGQR